MITIYSKPDCPKCKALKLKFKIKGIEYSEIQDIAQMKELGIQSLPAVDIDGSLLTFEKAIKYANER